MVFHFSYDSNSLEKRSKVYGRLILVCIVLLILAIQTGAQATNLGWDKQVSGITTDLFDISNDNGTLYTVGQDGIVLSSTDGIDWSPESIPITEDLMSVHAINNSVYTSGENGKVLKKSGASWLDVSVSTSATLRGIRVIDTDTIITAGDGGEIWQSTDGGTSWVQLISGTTEDIYAVDFLNSTWGLAVGSNGLILGTLDGTNWTIRDEINADVSSSILRGVDFQTSTRAYVTGDNGIFIRSEISANPIVGFVWGNWSNTETIIQFNDIEASSQNKVWVVGNDGSIYLTKNGGLTFSKQKINETLSAINFHAISIEDGINGHAVGSAGSLLSTDREGIAASDIPTVKDYSDFSVYWEDTKDQFYKGFVNMLKIIFFSMFIGFTLGIILAVMKTMKSRIITLPATIYTDIFRNTPLLVQFFLIHFGLPDLGIDLTIGGLFPDRSLISSVLALGLNSAAYQAEIIRGGIQAIPSGQMEAGRSVGLTYFQSMRYVILPQALRIVIPPLGNEFINLVLNSSLAMVTGYPELARSARLINAYTFKIFQTWIITALFYFVITYTLTNLLRVMEKRTKIPGLGLGGE
jgi:polar amino acid transport system permease protein